MKLVKKLKITLINLSIFVSAILVIELFFVLNAKFNFTTHSKKIIYSVDQMLSLAEAEKKYGFKIFGAPQNLKYKPDPRIKSLDPSQLNQTLKFQQFNAPNQLQKQVELRFLPPHEDVYIYSAHYYYNSDGSRKVENQESKTKAQNFVLTMGDSFTFGEGVSNGQELASQLTKKINDNWKVYNYGIPGASTNDFLYNLEFKPDYLNTIQEKKGIVIWYYIDIQLERFFCNLNCYQQYYDSYIQYRPYYKLEGNDFVYKGSFGETFDLRHLMLKALRLSEAVKYSGLALNDNYNPEQVDIFAKSFKSLFQQLKKKFAVEKFYFVTMGPIRSKNLLFKKLREESHITILDFSDIPIGTNEHLSHPIDGHPTAEFYWILSEALKNKIELK